MTVSVVGGVSIIRVHLKKKTKRPSSASRPCLHSTRRYSPTYLLAGWQQPVVVQGQGLDLQPGADAVRVVLNTSTCAGGPALLDVADLGPQNLSSAAFASVALQLGPTGLWSGGPMAGGLSVPHQGFF